MIRPSYTLLLHQQFFFCGYSTSGTYLPGPEGNHTKGRVGGCCRRYRKEDDDLVLFHCNPSGPGEIPDLWVDWCGEEHGVVAAISGFWDTVRCPNVAKIS
jgi:hypothetical protein